MSAAAPAFNVGVAEQAEKKLDMALDDIIKEHRQERKAKASASKKPAAVAKSVGTAKAQRAAKLAAKRGLAAPGSEATPMEIDQEVKRQTGRAAKAKARAAARQVAVASGKGAVPRKKAIASAKSAKAKVRKIVQAVKVAGGKKLNKNKQPLQAQTKQNSAPKLNNSKNISNGFKKSDFQMPKKQQQQQRTGSGAFQFKANGGTVKRASVLQVSKGAKRNTKKDKRPVIAGGVPAQLARMSITNSSRGGRYVDPRPVIASPTGGRGNGTQARAAAAQSRGKASRAANMNARRGIAAQQQQQPTVNTPQSNKKAKKPQQQQQQQKRANAKMTPKQQLQQHKAQQQNGGSGSGRKNKRRSNA